MSIKKVSKDQPDKFIFNQENLNLANKIVLNYPTGKKKALLWLYCILLKNKMIIGYL